LIQGGKLLLRSTPMRVMGSPITREYVVPPSRPEFDPKDKGINRTIEEMDDTGRQKGNREDNRGESELKIQATKLKEKVEKGESELKAQASKLKEKLENVKKDAPREWTILTDKVKGMGEKVKETGAFVGEKLSQGAKKIGLRK